MDRVKAKADLLQTPEYCDLHKWPMSKICRVWRLADRCPEREFADIVTDLLADRLSEWADMMPSCILITAGLDPYYVQD